MESTARFQAETVRDYLCKRGFQREHIVHYCYRPFDVRWLYWEPETKLLDEKRGAWSILRLPRIFVGHSPGITRYVASYVSTLVTREGLTV